MTSFPFVAACLLLTVAVISVVYALLSPGDRPQAVREAASGFGLMVGGLVALALLVEAIPWLLGR